MIKNPTKVFNIKIGRNFLDTLYTEVFLVTSKFSLTLTNVANPVDKLGVNLCLNVSELIFSSILETLTIKDYERNETSKDVKTLTIYSTTKNGQKLSNYVTRRKTSKL